MFLERSGRIEERNEFAAVNTQDGVRGEQRLHKGLVTAREACILAAVIFEMRTVILNKPIFDASGGHIHFSRDGFFGSHDEARDAPIGAANRFNLTSARKSQEPPERCTETLSVRRKEGRTISRSIASCQV